MSSPINTNTISDRKGTQSLKKRNETAYIAEALLPRLFYLAELNPSGPMLEEIIDMHPNVTIIRRQDEINLWDHEEFRKAVEVMGKSQLSPAAS